MEDKINITVSGDEVRILHGTLPKPINFEKQVIEGTIDAPSEFLKKRVAVIYAEKNSLNSSDKINFSPDAAYVVFDYGKNTIGLVINAAHPGEINVNGSFILNELFSTLKINIPEGYASASQLLGMIRYRSDIFETIEGHSEFLKRLRNFTMDVSRRYEKWSDQKGNAGEKLSTVVNEFTPLEFEIFTPIFNGEDKMKIKIDVEIEDRNGKIEFFLVSTELPRLIEDYKEKKFSLLKEDFKRIPIINK